MRRRTWLLSGMVVSTLANLSGTHFKKMINCFAWYMNDAAHRPDNSRIQGCNEEDILFCKTDSGHNDHFCGFHGSNVLSDIWETPGCYFNCQMGTCDAFSSPSNADQQQCVDDLYSGLG
jgi:hypothetical protein